MWNIISNNRRFINIQNIVDMKNQPQHDSRLQMKRIEQIDVDGHIDCGMEKDNLFYIFVIINQRKMYV